jgi:hypothetical protein
MAWIGTSEVWPWLTRAWFWLAAAVAAVSGLVACANHIISLRRSMREESERSAKKRHERKASVVATGGFINKSTFRVVLLNDGGSIASNVIVAFDGKPAHEHPCIRSPVTPLPSLMPKAQSLYEFLPHLGADRPRRVRIEWTDDSGEPGAYETQL